jgi:hypothetical protein
VRNGTARGMLGREMGKGVGLPRKNTKSTKKEGRDVADGGLVKPRRYLADDVVAPGPGIADWWCGTTRRRGSLVG